MHLYQYLGCHVPFMRLWISSLTDKAIKEGLDNLRDGHDYDRLYAAAKSRSEADWLMGIRSALWDACQSKNATQALTIAAGKGTYSLGRVQTPTLAMVCRRFLENKNFQPTQFWQMHFTTEGDGGAVKFLSADRWEDKDKAEALFQQLKGNKSVVIIKVECKEKTEEPPLLYDLTTLQKDANVNHRISFSSVVYAIHLKWIQWSHLGRDTRGAFNLIKTIRCRTALRRRLGGCAGVGRWGCSRGDGGRSGGGCGRCRGRCGGRHRAVGGR